MTANTEGRGILPDGAPGAVEGKPSTLYFDYGLQVWVEARRVLDCRHPLEMGYHCCNQRLYRGYKIEDAHAAEKARERCTVRATDYITPQDIEEAEA